MTQPTLQSAVAVSTSITEWHDWPRNRVPPFISDWSTKEYWRGMHEVVAILKIQGENNTVNLMVESLSGNIFTMWNNAKSIFYFQHIWWKCSERVTTIEQFCTLLKAEKQPHVVQRSHFKQFFWTVLLEIGWGWLLKDTLVVINDIPALPVCYRYFAEYRSYAIIGIFSWFPITSGWDRRNNLNQLGPHGHCA